MDFMGAIYVFPISILLMHLPMGGKGGGSLAGAKTRAGGTGRGGGVAQGQCKGAGQAHLGKAVVLGRGARDKARKMGWDPR